MQLTLEITCFLIHCILTSRNPLEIIYCEIFNVQLVQNSQRKRFVDNFLAYSYSAVQSIKRALGQIKSETICLKVLKLLEIAQPSNCNTAS